MTESIFSSSCRCNPPPVEPCLRRLCEETVFLNNVFDLYTLNIKVTLSDFFNILDLDKNGALSRSELHESARRLGWHWHEAPILAVLDLLAVLEPISRDNFIIYMSQIVEDPHGPFGKVLLNSPHFLPADPSRRTGVSKQKTAEVHRKLNSSNKTYDDTVTLLKEIAAPDIAKHHQDFLENLNAEKLKIPIDKAAVLIIYKGNLDEIHGFKSRI